MSARSLSSTDRLNMLAGVAKVAVVCGGYDWSHGRFEAHKAAEVAKAPPQSRWWTHRTRIYLLPLDMMLAGVALLPVVIALGEYDYALAQEVLGFVVVGLIITGAILTNVTLRGPAQWVIVPLEDYPHGSVPPEAHQIMGRIREALPGTRFLVHQLVQDTAQLDPGLEAIGPDGDSCIFYVWEDERTIVPN